jgi:type 1 glutamine amidotransferase
MLGLHPEIIGDIATLPPTRLSMQGILALFTIGETPFTPGQKKAISERWDGGRIGLLGVHSATDACHTWPEYGKMMGGRFDGHPWTQDFVVDVLDSAHPSTQHLPQQWPWRDEVYLFKDIQPGVIPLLRLAEGQLDMGVPDARVPEAGFPLAWTNQVGKGKTFYTALGHMQAAWENPVFLNHIAGGLRWLLGQ